MSQEEETIAQIVAEARLHGASVGIVPGASGNFASPEDFAALQEIGVDYFDAYPFDCPAWAMMQRDLDVMIAAHEGMAMGDLRSYETLGMTLCEASIMAHEILRNTTDRARPVRLRRVVRRDEGAGHCSIAKEVGGPRCDGAPNDGRARRAFGCHRFGTRGAEH